MFCPSLMDTTCIVNPLPYSLQHGPTSESHVVSRSERPRETLHINVHQTSSIIRLEKTQESAGKEITTTQNKHP